ncbi:MAG: outer membrane beta-barrel protein [Candidatus Latescibacterota bacterium]|nr:MAG: outer membrane beta-barrel protein [Candidatus Latescibacterota bacterium]
MKKMALLLCVLVIGYPTTSAAMVGVAVGGKAGFANYSGDVLPSSGDVGLSGYYGAVLEITTLPVLDFELHANYFTNDFVYTYEYGGVPITTSFQFQDFHVLALVKKNLIRAPGSPVALYLGAGAGWHLINTEAVLQLADSGSGYDPALADDPVALLKDSARMSADGLVGLKVSLPVMPLAIFSETRYGVIFTDASLRTFQIEAGVMLDL